MNDFLQLAQSLAVALKALQMYTAVHPRTQEAIAATQDLLDRWLLQRDKLQFVVSGPKAFVDGQLLEGRSPHIAALVKLVGERGVSGFIFERGVTPGELMEFLHGLAMKPARLEEVGGFEALLRTTGVRRIKVSQTRYQEVREGEEGPSEEGNPKLVIPPAPKPTPPSPEDLVTAMGEALLAALAMGKRATAGAGPALGAGRVGAGSGRMPGPGAGASSRGPGGEVGGWSNPILSIESDDPTGPDSEPEVQVLDGFQPADLSGLGPFGQELGLGDGMPSPAKLGMLRQVLMNLAPEAQLSLLAGLSTLPEHPAGLALGVKALAGEILAVATTSALAKGATWDELRGPLKDILRPLEEREVLVRALSASLRTSGRDASQGEAILRQLEWEALSLEARIVKVLEEGQLFELSLEQRLALLRELLDLHRFDEFLRIQDILLECLHGDRSDLRLKSAQTLAGVSRWAHEPGLPPEGEGTLAESLRAHFAWEPDPPIHRWTCDALGFLLAAMVYRGELGQVVADLHELDNLFTFLEEQQPWRNLALAKLKGFLLQPQLVDAALTRAFALERDRMLEEVHPYMEFLGAPVMPHLVMRLGEETDRTRRGRLVEVVRSMGPMAVPALLDALRAPAWFLVRNALTLLSDLGDAGCVSAVVALLRHPEPRVRRTAARTLWKLGGPVAEPHLLALMKDTDGETLQEILFALGQLRSVVGLPQVCELAQDKRVVERLRIQALETLGQIASAKALPVLLECMKRKTFFSAGEPPAIRLAAARAMAALESPEARTSLQKMADAEPKGEEREALRRLLERPVPS